MVKKKLEEYGGILARELTTGIDQELESVATTSVVEETSNGPSGAATSIGSPNIQVATGPVEVDNHDGEGLSLFWALQSQAGV